MKRVIGTCSECGGRVTLPTDWMSVDPPIPECESCGAVAASPGPVIKMRRRGIDTRPPHVRKYNRGPAIVWVGKPSDTKMYFGAG